MRVIACDNCPGRKAVVRLYGVLYLTSGGVDRFLCRDCAGGSLGCLCATCEAQSAWERQLEGFSA